MRRSRTTIGNSTISITAATTTSIRVVRSLSAAIATARCVLSNCWRRALALRMACTSRAQRDRATPPNTRGVVGRGRVWTASPHFFLGIHHCLIHSSFGPRVRTSNGATIYSSFFADLTDLSTRNATEGSEGPRDAWLIGPHMSPPHA